MVKKKLFWTLFALVALVAAGVGGYYYYSTQQASAAAATATEAAMQTAVASLGDLTISASGAGQVVPASEVGLGFDESGTLIELNVAVGQKVAAGEVLARLQTQNSAEEIQASIAEAELAVVQAQSAVNTLYATAETDRTTALNDIAAYAQAVRDAQYAMENYTAPQFMRGMTAIEALDKTKADLDAASKAFEPYRTQAQNDATRLALLETLNLAQSNYDSAVKRLNYEYVLDVANANLNKARQDYDKYKDGPAADELAQAQAELKNAQAKLDLAKQTQPVEALVAPSDGTIMSLSANVGEAVSTGAIITLADLSKAMVEIYLDETDLDKAAIGYEVEATFDAFPDLTFTGKVISVDPSLQTVSNVQAVKVTAELDLSDQDVKLPVGLNATVEVIAGKARNAVLVPVEALRELDQGEYAVFVVENGEPVLRTVQVGLKDITFAEIKSGLEAGEVVSTGIQQSTAQ